MNSPARTSFGSRLPPYAANPGPSHAPLSVAKRSCMSSGVGPANPPARNLSPPVRQNMQPAGKRPATPTPHKDRVLTQRRTNSNIFVAQHLRTRRVTSNISNKFKAVARCMLRIARRLGCSATPGNRRTFPVDIVPAGVLQCSKRTGHRSARLVEKSISKAQRPTLRPCGGLGGRAGDLQSPTRRGQVHVFGQRFPIRLGSSSRKMDQSPDFDALD